MGAMGAVGDGSTGEGSPGAGILVHVPGCPGDGKGFMGGLLILADAIGPLVGWGQEVGEVRGRSGSGDEAHGGPEPHEGVRVRLLLHGGGCQGCGNLGGRNGRDCWGSDCRKGRSGGWLRAGRRLRCGKCPDVPWVGNGGHRGRVPVGMNGGRGLVPPWDSSAPAAARAPLLVLAGTEAADEDKDEDDGDG